MVKNQTGGSGHKKFARKHEVTAKVGHKLRVSEDEGEIYSIVTKCLGNNMFQCLGVDSVLRLGHIRGKFSGRGRRDNTITAGSWVLVGIREWDAGKLSAKGKVKLPECDLMEVYNDHDKSRLRDTVAADWNVLIIDEAKRKGGTDAENTEDVFHFTTDREIELEQLIDDMKSDKIGKVTLTITEGDKDGEEEIINFDDI